MTRQEAAKWADILQDAHRMAYPHIAKRLMELFGKPEPKTIGTGRRVMVDYKGHAHWELEGGCEGYCTPASEQPPDVSKLTWRGLDVQIAEPVTRAARVGEHWLCPYSGAAIYGLLEGIDVPVWILRIKPAVEPKPRLVSELADLDDPKVQQAIMAAYWGGAGEAKPSVHATVRAIRAYLAMEREK